VKGGQEWTAEGKEREYGGGDDYDDGHENYILRIFTLVLGISSLHIQPYI